MATEHVHAVISGDGLVTDTVVLDPATARTWTGDGTAAELWPGATLLDITDADPRPGIGWTRTGNTWTAPPEPKPPALAVDE